MIKTWSDKLSGILPKIKLSKEHLIMYTNFMMIVAIMGSIPLSIQCWKIYNTKKVNDFSLTAFFFQICISILWIMYAIFTRNGVIIISSTLSIIIVSLIIFFIYKYRS